MGIKIKEMAAETAKNVENVLEACKELGYDVKNSTSSITDEQAQKLYEYIINGAKPEEEKPKKSPKKTKVQQSETQQSKTPPKEEKEIAKKTSPSRPSRSKKRAQKRQEEKEQVKTEKVEVEEDVVRLARRSITIIKKKNPRLPTYGKRTVLKDNNVKETQEKKKTKQKKQNLVGKKEQGIKLDLLADRDLVEYDEQEDLIFMPDLFTNIDTNLDSQRPTKPSKKTEFFGQTAPARRNRSRSRSKDKKPSRPTMVVEPEIKVAHIPEDVRVYEFAEIIGKSVGEIIQVLFGMGMFVTKNDFLEKDYIEILADEFDIEVEVKNVLDELDYVSIYDQAHQDLNEERPPIVTIMGHVDHGKTSLLDYIRNSKVATSEAGGITQHIGAYTITKNNKKITFIDTPGHEAFTQMRARGANATDVVIIVVAADDGVMPQTKEAISHARASKSPMIVAINKIDKEGANIDMVKSQLAELDMTPTDWGGEHDCIGVSAHTGDGIEDLLETILIQSEILELKANSKDPAKAVVVESSIEKGRGVVTTVIVQNGSLNVGDNVLVGASYGRIRAIMNEKAQQVQKLSPSEAGEIIGLDSSPMSGEILVCMSTEREARDIALKRRTHQRQRHLSHSIKASLDDFHSLIKEGKLRSLRIILKADVQGTLEVLETSLAKLRNEEVKVDIIHSAVGAITQSDVSLASASEHTVILGFNIKPSANIKEQARIEGVEIRAYGVIYDLIDDVKKVLGTMLSPLTKEEKSGTAQIKEVFDIASKGRIAGCIVTAGEISRGSTVVVYREDKEIYKGKLSSLKRFKDDVKEVKKGYECGIALEGFNETQPGDIIECIKEIEIAAEFKQDE